MNFSRQALFSLLAGSALVCNTQAVLYGDEQYGDIEGGRFWAFHGNGVAVVNPETCAVEDTIDGDDLPERWYDGVYMEYHNHDVSESRHDHVRKLAHEHEDEHNHYILINSGLSSDPDPVTGEVTSEILVFDTDTRSLASRIEGGGRMVHSYGVHNRNEFWSHSDLDGMFYIVHLSDLNDHIGETVTKFEDTPSHGKLLWSESSKLGNRAFATGTSEKILWEVNMETRTDVRKYNYANDVPEDVCRGLHAIAYSSQSEHIFAECSGGGGILEFNVANDNIEFLYRHADQTGSLYETPDGKYVVATNKSNNKMHVFKPEGNGVQHAIEAEVTLDGNPSTVSFYPKGSDNFIACMPQVENPIENQSFKCDYYDGCNDARSEEDVNAGVCLYDPADNSKLLRITKDSDEEQALQTGTGETAPYYNACNRCKVDDNFENGECICTPNCGSCQSDKSSSDSDIGSYCVDLNGLISESAGAITHIPGAGAVNTSGGYGSTECGYGRTYRTHKRGGKYDASVANVPDDSIVIVDMSTQTMKCHVKIDGAPSRVLYVPPNNNENDESGALSLNSSFFKYSLVFVGMLASMVF